MRVVDLSHHNTVTDFSKRQMRGSSESFTRRRRGPNFVDATYDAHRARAKDAGLLWGRITSLALTM